MSNDVPTSRLVNGVAVPLSAAEIQAINAEWAAAPAVLAAEKITQGRASAKQGVDTPVMRAVLLVLLDEINTLRTAAKLAPRTIAQMRQALTDKIDAGTAD